jgi:hypothetical protein
LPTNALAYFSAGVVDVNSKVVGLGPGLHVVWLVMPGANPAIVSYNASAIKIYNFTSSLVSFENKNMFFLSRITLWPVTAQALYIVVMSRTGSWLLKFE